MYERERERERDREREKDIMSERVTEQTTYRDEECLYCGCVLIAVVSPCVCVCVPGDQQGSVN